MARKWETPKNFNTENLIHQLIAADEKSDFPSLWLSAQLLGLDLSTPIVAFVVAPRGKEEESRGINDRIKILALVRNFFDPSRHLASTVGPRIFVVLRNFHIPMTLPKEEADFQREFKQNLAATASSLQKYIFDEAQQKVSVGIGRCHQGELGPKLSFQEALMALQIGERLEENSVYDSEGSTTRGGIFHIADYPLLPFLSSNSRDQLARSYRDVTAVLLKNPELRGSLKAFLEANFNVSTAAKKLFLHRNTLIYRLRKISSLTGLDPRKFREAIQLYMALQLSCLEEMSEKKRT